ncbi:DUF6573 family protein [Kitasatospora sp. NPDC002551]|uniref:DUF6573 family protein n=1 Tax=Kitasatospora sp. NPDC002551 TaxID=3154539 RepID=UPI00331DB73A
MSDKTATDPMDEGGPIATYSRAEAIADGVLVQVPEVAWRVARFRWPVALTADVHGRCVAWGGDPEMEGRRLAELLGMAHAAIRRSGNQGGRSVSFAFVYMEMDNPADDQEVWLTVAAGPGDDGEPVMTVMFPHED